MRGCNCNFKLKIQNYPSTMLLRNIPVYIYILVHKIVQRYTTTLSDVNRKPTAFFFFRFTGWHEQILFFNSRKKKKNEKKKSVNMYKTSLHTYHKILDIQIIQILDVSYQFYVVDSYTRSSSKIYSSSPVATKKKKNQTHISYSQETENANKHYFVPTPVSNTQYTKQDTYRQYQASCQDGEKNNYTRMYSCT